MMKQLFLIFMLVLFITACASVDNRTPEEKLADAEKTADGYYELDAATANYLIREEKNIIVLEITSDYYQYKVGHLPYAVNIQISGLKDIDTGRPYLVYSRDNISSQEAAKNIVMMSEQPVYRLKGDYGLWASSGYGVDTKKCHMTVGSEPAEYNHAHVWCEEEAETLQYCNEAGKCHNHRMLRSLNLADKTLPGPHSHNLS